MGEKIVAMMKLHHNGDVWFPTASILSSIKLSLQALMLQTVMNHTLDMIDQQPYKRETLPRVRCYSVPTPKLRHGWLKTDAYVIMITISRIF